MTESKTHIKVGLLPLNWNAFKLSEVIDLLHGYQFRSDDFTEKGLAVIKISNVIGSGLYTDEMTFIDPNRYNEFSQYEILEGDILMSLTGNIGRVVEVGALDRKYLQNYRVGKFVPVNADRLDKKYIKYLLSSPVVLNQFFKFSNQSAQANFGKQDMDKVWVAIPTQLSEQQKIAEILSTVDEKIVTIDQKIKETEALKKGMMQRLLTKGIGHTRFKDSPLGEIPADWKVFKLSQVIDLIHGYQFRTDDFTEKGLAVIKISNVIGSKLYTEELTYIDSNRYDEFSKFEIFEGDILMSLTGNIGRVVEVGKIDRIYLQNYRVGKFTPVNNNQLCTRYIKYLLSSPLVLSQFYKFSNQSAQANFGKQDMDKVWVTIPTELAEQKKIAVILSTVEEKLAIFSESKNNYQDLKKGLMQRLLTGKIRVNSLNKNEVTA